MACVQKLGNKCLWASFGDLALLAQGKMPCLFKTPPPLSVPAMERIKAEIMACGYSVRKLRMHGVTMALAKHTRFSLPEYDM